MMKLSTMLRVDSTVDTQSRSRIAERILEQWEHDQGSAQFFRSSANFVYIFRKGGECYFLRFAESAQRTCAELEAEMALLSFLAGQAMTVATPVASKNGRWVEAIETDLGIFHAVVFAQLQGREVEIEELGLAQFERWGAALGKLHALTHRYQDPKASARGTWRDHLTLVRNVVSKNEPRVQAECDYLTSFLAALPVTETNSGLIHGDFELDNLRWQDETIAIFDFDECASSWYIADVAFALRDLFKTSVDLSHPSFRAFIRGYREQYALDEELISNLPTFMRLVNLIMYAKLVWAMDLAQDQDYPAWCTPLLLGIENWKQNYKASLLSMPL
ncbi:MAG: phosphotransferase enzyme family protein [Ktedonobacteraceae bacterium]